MSEAWKERPGPKQQMFNCSKSKGKSTWGFTTTVRLHYIFMDPNCIVFRSVKSARMLFHSLAIWFRHTRTLRAEGLSWQYIKCFHLISFSLPSSFQLNHLELCYCWFFTAVAQQQCPAYAFFMACRILYHPSHFLIEFFINVWVGDRQERFILIIMWLLDHFSHTAMAWHEAFFFPVVSQLELSELCSE